MLGKRFKICSLVLLVPESSKRPHPARKDPAARSTIQISNCQSRLTEITQAYMQAYRILLHAVHGPFVLFQKHIASPTLHATLASLYAKQSTIICKLQLPIKASGSDSQLLLISLSGNFILPPYFVYGGYSCKIHSLIQGFLQHLFKVTRPTQRCY